MTPRLLAGALCAALALASAEARAVDVVAQDVTVDVSGPVDATSVVLDVSIEATSPTGSLSFYRLGLPVVAADLDGTPVTVEPDPSYPQYLSRIVLPAPLAAGDGATLHLELAGALSCSVSGYPGIFCWRAADETVLTPSMPGTAWYFLGIEGVDPFAASIAVRAPDGHTVVAGSSAADAIEPNGDGTTTHRFSVSLGTELLALYAGAADTLTLDEGFPVRVVHHADRHDPENVARVAAIASAVVPVLESHYGELPLDEARVVVVPQDFGFGALGLLGTVLLNEVVVGPAEALIEQGIAHELAHSWWGNLASGANPIERRFLGEAFAEYAAWRALGELWGDAARTSGMRMNAVWYMYRRPNDADVPVLSASTDSSPAAIHVIYHKGPLVLRTLEEAAGPEGFFTALEAFVARGYGGLSIDALVDDIAASSGYDASADIDQWLRATGFPRIRAAAELGTDGATLSLTSEGEFSFGLPVTLVHSGGRTSESRIDVAPGESVLDVPIDAALEGEPTALEIDPRWTAVREITPAVLGDVTLDGAVDGADLVALAVHHGAVLPLERRIDGRYDPLYDLDRDGTVGDADLDIVRAAILAR